MFWFIPIFAFVGYFYPPHDAVNRIRPETCISIRVKPRPDSWKRAELYQESTTYLVVIVWPQIFHNFSA